MILTGIRPINLSNLKWSYVTDNEIIYPATTIGLRGAMKNQREFRIPITPQIRIILDEQNEWRLAAGDRCSQEYVFLQPRNPMLAFSKRTVWILIREYSPEDCLFGDFNDNTVKGRDGAFPTMCRKFLKTNVIVQMRKNGYSRQDARETSQLCMHHVNDIKKDDPMSAHYDFSDEFLHEEMALKRTAFELHERSILAQIALIRSQKQKKLRNV